MRRVDGHWCQDKQDLFVEALVQPVAIPVAQTSRRHQLDAIVFQFIEKVQPTLVLLAHQVGSSGAHAIKLFSRRQPVLRDFRHILAYLCGKAGHPNHEEFIQVVAGNGQEAEPLEQGVIGVAGFHEDAVVEAEPAQFAVEEALWRGAQGIGVKLTCSLGHGQGEVGIDGTFNIHARGVP